MRRDDDRLQDILEAIERIQRHTANGRTAFEEGEVIQAAVLHWIEIIGEASRGLSPGLRDANLHVPWPQIIAMRNAIANVYFAIDVDAAWKVIQHDLPVLETDIRAILATTRSSAEEAVPDLPAARDEES